MPAVQTPVAVAGKWRWVPLVVVVALYGLLAVRLWQVATRGIDLTDESFYILSYLRPADNHLSWFDLVLSPVFAMCRGDVVAFRLLGFVITAAMAAFAVHATMASASRRDAGMVAMAVGIAGLAFLCYYTPFIATPSYNTLVLWSGCLVWSGLCHAIDRQAGGRRRWLGMASLALGGALLALAKPPAAALLAPVALAVLLAAGIPRLMWLSSGLASLAGVALVLLLSAGGWQAFVRVVGEPFVLHAQIANAGYALGEVYSPWRYLAVAVDAKALLPALVFIVAPAALLIRAPGARLPILAAGLGMVGMALLTPARGLALPCSVVLVWIWQQRRRTEDHAERMPAGEPVLITAGILLPMLLTTGTNNSYVASSGNLALFYGLCLLRIAGLDVVRRVPGIDRICAFAALGMAIMAAMGVIRASNCLYRSDAPIWQQTSMVTLPGSTTAIGVSPRMQAFVEEVRAKAGAAGMRAGDRLLDATGQLPGLAYILEARPLGFEWVCGGYECSGRWLRTSLSQTVPSERSASWIVASITAEGRIEIPLGEPILREFGIDIRAWRPVHPFIYPGDGGRYALLAPEVVQVR